MIILALAHVVIAATVIWGIQQQYAQRSQQVGELRHTAQAEATDAAQLQREVEVLEHLLDGMRKEDPYVIELLARDRLGYRNPERLEVPPPRLPADDK
ncbi:MAG: hypothetical protein EA401_08110 [Planctomycetota bacterium]|nr:MAG: hypothetical protein EA401_08110 [Planctomycetota bacterium]